MIISYSIFTDGGDELENCLEGYSQPRFILFNDGRTIIFDKGQYWEIVLSKNELIDLISQIEDTGISYLGKIEEPISFDQLTFKNRVFHFSRHSSPEKPLIDTLEMINQVQLINPKPYVPDALLMFIYSPDDFQEHLDYLPPPIPQPEFWPLTFLPLSEFPQGFNNIEGEPLSLIMDQFNGFPDYRIYKEGALNYIVALCANFQFHLQPTR